jgi:stage V sporulation protein AC
MTNKEYNDYVKAKAKPSPIVKDCLWAFVVGGLICTAGQALNQLYQHWGMSREDAGTWVSVTLVFTASLLTGLGVFDDIARRAGAGTLVPITGFSNAMVSPALEFKSEGFVTGTAVKLFTIAGPVLVFGISASVVYGVILWAIGLF